MIKLYCDICGEEADSLQRIQTKVEYSNISPSYGIDVVNFVEKAFVAQEDNICNYLLCKRCTKVVLVNSLDNIKGKC